MKLRKMHPSTFCMLLLILLHEQAAGQVPVQAAKPEKENRRVANECNISTEEAKHIFSSVGIVADYKGGAKGWFDYAQRNFDFNYVTRKVGDTTQPFKDSIVVRFVVTRKGQLCDFTRLRGNQILAEPVFALLRNAPDWYSAKSPAGSDLTAYRTLRVDVEMDHQQQRFTVIPNHVDFYRKNDR